MVERVLTDNARPYDSHRWLETCAEIGIEHRYTRPYSPWTNGKAEALIKTLLREWAYRVVYPTSEHRSRALNTSSAGTTADDPTALLAAAHQSAASHTSLVSTPSGRAG
jgi:transposase InsO family protein